MYGFVWDFKSSWYIWAVIGLSTFSFFFIESSFVTGLNNFEFWVFYLSEYIVAYDLLVIFILFYSNKVLSFDWYSFKTLPSSISYYSYAEGATFWIFKLPKCLIYLVIGFSDFISHTVSGYDLVINGCQVYELY